MKKSGGEGALHKFRTVKRQQAIFALLALLGVIMLSGTMYSTAVGTGMSIDTALAPSASAPGPFVPTATPSPKIPDLGKIPLAFEPNAGQAASPVQYLARMPSGLLSFSPSQIDLLFARPNSGKSVRAGGSAGPGSQDSIYSRTGRSPEMLAADLALPSTPIALSLQWVGASPSAVISTGAVLP